ncbi:hypothetical protein [Streptomyces litchfieldiae]|uniref:Integral membrane protein n=1 Tax=Streptomyces litchfieldiae TaxID=3075543 RepID=A0ABU2MMJ1_9ACTN|nr:hypothetical protein [Streptomyces sp. DSM 44938]MDT0342691.1 hypothetical protein [Streptomyces sp. DSM 44938]
MTARAPRVWSTAGAFGRAALLVLLAWAVAGTITAVSYLALGVIAVPILTGVVLGVGFVVAVIATHQAFWLGLLALVCGLPVLVGAVQYAPEAALDRRGVAQEVVITDVDVTGKRHEFRLSTVAGEALAERLDYQGSSPPYQIGDRLTVISDPEGTVPLEDAAKVDPDAKLGMLGGGTAVWTLIALYAARRGHVRRRNGKSLSDTPALY